MVIAKKKKKVNVIYTRLKFGKLGVIGIKH